jgi:hypothetical protein
MRATVTQALLARMKQQFDSQFGSFRSVTAVNQVRQEGLRAIELVTKYEKSAVSVRVVFDGFDRIAALHVDPIAPPAVDSALEASARELIANFNAGRFDEAGKLFDIRMHGQLPPASLADLAKKVAIRYGAFRSITKVEQRTEAAYRTIDVTAAYEKSPAGFHIVFDRDGLIAGLNIRPAATP